MSARRVLSIAVASMLMLGLVAGGRWVVNGVRVATGYAAKQLCSGVFVAGLPASFIIENDINVTVGTLGPLLPHLDLTLDRDRQRAEASLLGVRAEARYEGRSTGCVLNPAAPLGGTRPPLAKLELPAKPGLGLPALAPVLEQAFAEPGPGQRRTLAVLVLKEGERLAERYAPEVTATTPMQGWSMNKSLTATWVGMQVERGRLALDMSVAEQVATADPRLSENIDPSLTLGHLLHMESGFAFEETYLPGDDATRMLYLSPAAWRVAPGNGHAYPPGEHFSYSSGDTNLASWIWQRSLARWYPGWLEEEFAEPLGLVHLTSEHDASAVQVGSSFTYMTPRDWARVGQFWLDAWHGRSDMLSREWMRAASRPRASAVHGNYGRGFWLNAQGHDFPNLPRNLFYASGHNGQFVVVFPDQEIVVVRLGLSSDGRSTGLSALLEGVIRVLADRPAPDRPEAAGP